MVCWADAVEEEMQREYRMGVSMSENNHAF